MEPDERLLLRLRDGDLKAFDALYLRYERPLFAFLLCSLKNRADAEDAFHEAFLRALKNAERDFQEGGFRAWLFRVARNVALNRLRKGTRGAKALQSLDLPPEPPAAPEAMEQMERERALARAVDRLPASMAELYRLRVSGLSYDEIAHVLDAPIGTVKSRMSEMVRLLREEMRPWTARS